MERSTSHLMSAFSVIRTQSPIRELEEENRQLEQVDAELLAAQRHAH
jgi:hypothetical protein